jgi:hypothetical protein
VKFSILGLRLIFSREQSANLSRHRRQNRDALATASMGRDNRGKGRGGRGGRGGGRMKMADREIEELEAAIKVRASSPAAAPRNLSPPPTIAVRPRIS